jgi:hypothetical protein
MRQGIVTVAVMVGLASVAMAQIPVGNQNTFGRNGANGLSFPFLNRHAYSTQTDPGRPFPFLNRHAYSTQTDPGRPIPGRAPRQMNLPGPGGSVQDQPSNPISGIPGGGMQPVPGGFYGVPFGYPVVPTYFNGVYGPYVDFNGVYYPRFPMWPGFGWYPPAFVPPWDSPGNSPGN